ncbi:Uma2 family endonuclease [Streptomyces europaeiscabiei]|uniref:Uma2 family endonuclease n=1 Tax=Streptomyces europaeiscabiei TaxID=146819 RepID=UPI002E13A85B|nr:Uma2 family endonuclease [Streptomyces europaeiscabiei]
MTVSGIDRLHSQLSRLEDMFPGYLTEIVEGSIMMSPVKPHHAETIRLVWNTLREQVAEEWGFTSDVAFPFDEENEFCPDLAIIPTVEVAKNDGAYSPDLIELVVEVVSQGSIRRDYELKPRWYASRGIANYLVFDPLKGHCVTMWNPGPDGYRGRDTIPYGTDLTVDSPLGKLTFATARLPVDPKARPTR